MRQIRTILWIMVVVLTLATVSYGAEQNKEKEILPRFSSLSSVTVDTNIKGSTAYSKVTLEPKSAAPDYVKVVVKLMKEGSSTAIKSWAKTLYLTDAGDFYFEGSQLLTRRGTYYTEATIECYRGGTVVDDLIVASEMVEY